MNQQPTPGALRATESIIKAMFLDDIGVVRDEITAIIDRETAPQWQPIETAPKDRTVDCHNGGTRFSNCQWSQMRERFEFTAFDGGRYDTEATHWMEIPEPPKSQPQPPIEPASEPWRYFHHAVHGVMRTSEEGVVTEECTASGVWQLTEFYTVDQILRASGWTEITPAEAGETQTNDER